MTGGTSYSEPKKEVQLYKKRGETSRFIDAEITEDGDLVIFCQDVGKLPREIWGDADYEFWVHVPAKYKNDVIRVLLEKFYTTNPKAADEFRNFITSRGMDKDDVLLALMKKIYARNPEAVDEFRDFMRSQGIPGEFHSWI